MGLRGFVKHNFQMGLIGKFGENCSLGPAQFRVHLWWTLRRSLTLKKPSLTLMKDGERKRRRRLRRTLEVVAARGERAGSATTAGTTAGTRAGAPAALCEMTPLQKVTTIEDFSDAALFFASDQSRSITGQNLTVDGGLTFN